MRHAAVAALLALSLLPAGSARAQTPILVDRDALARKLRDYHHQLEGIQQQVMSMGPRGPQAAQMAAGFQSLNDQLRALERDIRTLPPAPAACANQMPQVVMTPPPPVVVQPQPHPGWQQPNAYPSYPPPPPPGYPNVPPPAAAMPTIPDETFNAVIDSIENQSFSADKIRTLQDGVGSQYLMVSHVERVLPLFSFSQDKLRALELMAPRLVDRQNAFKIYNLFTFSADKEKARRILGR